MLSGYGAVYIANFLTKEKILKPSAMKLKSGDTIFQIYLDGGYEYRWTDGSVQGILKNPVYTGDMVNAKTQIVNYKTKKCVTNSKDKLIIVPNTHEALITKEEFNRVQQLNSERHNSRKKYDVENLFRGLIKCSVCGSSMVLTTQMRRGKLMIYYRCNNFTSFRVEDKHWTTIKYDDIKDIVIDRLKEFFSVFKNDDKFMNMIRSKIKDNNVTINYDKEITKVETRQITLSNITKKVYDDYFEGLINKDTYLDLIKKYQSEQNDLKDKYNLLLNERKGKKNTLEDIVQSFLELNVLKQELVYNLIDKIEINNIGGYKQHKQREVNITYRFIKPEK